MAVTASPLANHTVLRGQVTDAVDGEPVVGASVYFPVLKVGTVTDAEGRYVVDRLPVVKTTIQVSFVGHQTIIETIDLHTTTTRDFVLHENNAMLGEVVVTGLTGQSLAYRTPSPVSVVSARSLQETPSTNIIDAVSRQPGVSQITTGSGISKPVIRGLGYNRIVTVNDGIRQEGQQWGDEHGIEIDAQSVHSIEILKGPASLMYGSDALAGVLVMHEAPVMPQGKMAASVGGEYQTNQQLYDYTVNFAGNRQGVVWNWRWSEKDAGDYKNKEDGRVSGTQFHERALTGMLGVNQPWGYSHLKLSGYHIKPGLVGGGRDALGHLEPSEAYQKIYHYKAALDNSFFIGDGALKVLVGYQQNRRQEFGHDHGDISEKSEVRSEKYSYMNASDDHEHEHGEAGLDFRLHTVNYDVHYQSVADDKWQYAAGVSGMWQHSENLGEEFLIPSYKLFDVGVFASLTRNFRSLVLSGGLRYDRRHLHSYALEHDGEQHFADFTRNFNGVTGSVGAILLLTKRLNLRLNLSRGFRAPNLSELGSNGSHKGTFRYELGNTALSPEYSWQGDLGFDYSSEVVSAQLSLFASHISNFIFLQRLNSPTPQLPNSSTPQYRYTAGDARLWGGEVMVDIHPVEPLHFENTFSFVNAVQLHQPDDSRYLPFTPAPRWTSDLRYDIIRDGDRWLNNTFASVGLECYLKQNHVHTANDTETATPSYTLLNMTLGTDICLHGRRLCSLFLTGTNLLDRAYQSHLSRLKYAGGPGVCNMGRNIGIKLQVPIRL